MIHAITVEIFALLLHRQNLTKKNKQNGRPTESERLVDMVTDHDRR
jgi:hypothetical protein